MTEDESRLEAAVQESMADQARAARGLGLLLLSMVCAVIAVAGAAVVLLRGGGQATPSAVGLIAAVTFF